MLTHVKPRSILKIVLPSCLLACSILVWARVSRPHDKDVATSYFELGRFVLQDGSKLVIVADPNTDHWNRSIAWQRWKQGEELESDYLGVIETKEPYRDIELTCHRDDHRRVYFYDASTMVVYGAFDVDGDVPSLVPRDADGVAGVVDELGRNHNKRSQWLVR